MDLKISLVTCFYRLELTELRVVQQHIDLHRSLRSSHRPTQWTIKQLRHKMTPEALTLRLNPPPCLPRIVITLFLRDIVVWHVPSSSFVKMFTEFLVEVASLEPEDKVVEDDAGLYEDDGPFVIFW
jgi:hypothetical protein